MIAHFDCSKIHCIVHFKTVKMVNFMLCDFYLNKKINK